MSEYSFLNGRLGFPLDDSWIHLQFARNLHLGDGLSYNPGEPVAGSTAPLWTALMSLLFWLPGSVVLWIKVVGIAFHLAGLHATFVLGRELGLRMGMAAFAAAMTALTSWLIWSALSGMEIPLFIWLSVWGVIWHIRERRAGSRVSFSLPLFGLAALGRPEGLLLLGLAAMDRLLVWRRDGDGLRIELGSVRAIVRGLLTAALFFIPIAVLNVLFSGSLLPTTFGAKSTGLQSFAPDLRYIYTVLSVFMPTQPWLFFLSLAGVVVSVERLGTQKDRGLLPGLWLVSLPMAYSTLGGAWDTALVGNFGRYYFPLFPFMAVLGTLGAERAAEALGSFVRLGSVRLPIRAVLVLLMLWPTTNAAIAGSGRYLQMIDNVEQSDVKMAEWLETRLDRRAVIAVNDVGALKYMLPNRILDLAGIIDPEVPKYMEEARQANQNWQFGVLRFLKETKPDYLVIFPAWFPNLSELDPGFAPQFELTIPNNITMGGNTIVVFSTPWTRYPLAVGTQE